MSREYLLLLRFAILNIAALGLLALAWQQGWVEFVLSNDVTRLTLIILAVFVIGWGLCIHKIWHCSRQLNAVTNPDIDDERVHKQVESLHDSVRAKAAAAVRALCELSSGDHCTFPCNPLRATCLGSERRNWSLTNR